MRSRFWPFVVCAAIVVAVLAAVGAQGQMRYARRGPGGMGMGMGRAGGMPGLVNNPLTADQVKKIADIRANTQAQVMSVRADSKLSAAERNARIAEIRQRGHEQVMSVLTADQRKEFESWWSTRGRMGMRTHGMRRVGGMGGGPGRMAGMMPGLVNNPLTAEQQKKIADIRANTQAQVMSVRADSKLSAAERNARIAEIRQRGHEQVMNVLTADQRKEFESWWSSRGVCPGVR